MLKLPSVARPITGPGVHPSTSPCFCTLQLQDCPSSSSHTVPLPLASDPTSTTNLVDPPANSGPSPPVSFSLDRDALNRLSAKPGSGLVVSVYVGRTGRTCGFSSGRLLGRVKVPVDLRQASARPAVVYSGWLSVGTGRLAVGRVHLVVRTEPDPRFVFQFGGEPESSPVVYQIRGQGGTGHSSNVRQPVFSCRFATGRRQPNRSMSSDCSKASNITSCFTAFRRERHQKQRTQRKGWTVTIHDLSGSPVAAASMVTPFVPSPGSDRVSRSNPGAWLILRNVSPSSTANWKAWGRLEAWRERGPASALGYRFELVTDTGTNSGVPIVESSLTIRNGGKFCIDPSFVNDMLSVSSPFTRGFVMASTVEGEGKVSKPTVQVGVHHVSCMADLALFIALSAAIDLSMDACRLFSQKLRKEFCVEQQDYNL